MPRQSLLGREGEREGFSIDSGIRIGSRRDGSLPMLGRKGYPIAAGGLPLKNMPPVDRRVDGMTIKGRVEGMPIGGGRDGGMPINGRDGMPINGRDGMPINGGRDGMPINGRDGMPSPLIGRDGLPINQRLLNGRRPFGNRRRLRGPTAAKYRQVSLTQHLFLSIEVSKQISAPIGSCKSYFPTARPTNKPRRINQSSEGPTNQHEGL